LRRGDPALASFHLKKLLDRDASRRQLDLGLKLKIYEILAGLSYDAGDLEQAYRYYLEIVNLSPADCAVAAEIWLRLAEIAFYTLSDREASKQYLLRYLALGPEDPSRQDGQMVDRLSRRLRWSDLPSETMGLDDSNISAVAVDGDDIWVGTWNGGISRYSVGDGKATVFKRGNESLTARTVRSIEVTPERVWIGTYQGLFQYSKFTSRWQAIDLFGGYNPKKIEALEAVGEIIYLGTLGDGLWRHEQRRWERIVQGGLPGAFINCLLRHDEYLLIGTLDRGLVLLDLRTGAMMSFDSVNRDLRSRNITMLLVEKEEILWIGTYGQGLYRWDPVSNDLEHHSKASGMLGDDWVLCGIETDTGLYFGTFGAGVTRLLPASLSARQIGLGEGLPALDISAASYGPPLLYFGTLGSGISILDESLVLDGSSGIE
jgi:hypothetical protein